MCDKKYIIMFKGGVETLEYFSMEIARTFEEEGYVIYWYNLIYGQEAADELVRFIDGIGTDSITGAFTFNFEGIAGEDGLYATAASESVSAVEAVYGSVSYVKTAYNIWNRYGIHIYNMVVDHPFYYHKYIKFIPQNYTQISIDRNHKKYLERFFPEIETYFVPLAGTGLYDRHTFGVDRPLLSLEDRKIDVIFTGNYTRPETFDKYLAEMDEDYKKFYYSLVDEVYNNPDMLIEETLEKRLREELDEDFDDMQLRDCMPNLAFVDLSVRFLYRAEVIRQLADSGIKVHIVGAGWDKLECKCPWNLYLYGMGDSQECLDKIAQSKISVNIMPWFKAGAHDRIFNSMLNGAVSVSDGSSYLNETFDDGKDMIYYSLNNIAQVPEKIKELLSSPQRLKSIADNAYEKCINNHTWHYRAKKILEIMQR